MQVWGRLVCRRLDRTTPYLPVLKECQRRLRKSFSPVTASVSLLGICGSNMASVCLAHLTFFHTEFFMAGSVSVKGSKLQLFLTCDLEVIWHASLALCCFRSWQFLVLQTVVYLWGLSCHTENVGSTSNKCSRNNNSVPCAGFHSWCIFMGLPQFYVLKI